MSRVLTLAVLSAVPLTLLAVPAKAATQLPTAITDFTTSATKVSYQQPMTFDGNLVEYSGKVTSSAPNEPVQIQLRIAGQSTYTQVASGTTDATGHFTISTTLPSGGYVRAVFAGDSGLYASAGTPSLLQASNVASRLVLDQVPASVAAGTQVTFSGTLEVQVDGEWQPFRGYAPLTLTMEPYTSSLPDVTYATQADDSGRFSLTETVPETSDWSVSTAKGGSYWAEWLPEYAGAGYGWMKGIAQTRIVGFSLPSRDEAHHAWYSGLYATGTVQAWTGTSWIGLVDGTVKLYYRPKGTKTWKQDFNAYTDESGHFRNIVGVHLGAADWQVRVVAADDTLTSTSTNTVTSTITDKTHFSSASADRRSTWSSIYGQITDWYNGQVSFSSLRGLKLKIYYRRKGTSKWYYAKTIKVGKDGLFSTSVKKGRGYYFKVVLPTQGPYLSSTTKPL